MKLDKHGNLIVATGFDGGTYSPQYASRTSVFLGDMTSEDVRIKKQVAARQKAIAIQNAQAKVIERAKANYKYMIADRMKAAVQHREMMGALQLERARARGYEAAKKSSRQLDINPWVGNPHAGFGSEGEQRINPDSAVDVEIVDANIPSVAEYGISNWMEDPSHLVDRLESADNSYTTGKRVLATLVDYAKSEQESVVGMPVASIVSKELTASGVPTSAVPNPAPVSAPVASAQPDYVRYGLYALAAYIFLR